MALRGGGIAACERQHGERAPVLDHEQAVGGALEPLLRLQEPPFRRGEIPVVVADQAEVVLDARRIANGAELGRELGAAREPRLGLAEARDVHQQHPDPEQPLDLEDGVALGGGERERAVELRDRLVGVAAEPGLGPGRLVGRPDRKPAVSDLARELLSQSQRPQRFLLEPSLLGDVAERDECVAAHRVEPERGALADDLLERLRRGAELSLPDHGVGTPQRQLDAGDAVGLRDELERACVEAERLAHPLAQLRLLAGPPQCLDRTLDRSGHVRAPDLACEQAGLLEVVREDLDELVAACRKIADPVGEAHV